MNIQFSNFDMQFLNKQIKKINLENKLLKLKIILLEKYIKNDKKNDKD